MLIDNVNVKPIDQNTISFYDYRISRNGTVKKKNGKVLKQFSLHYPYSHITLNINGRSCKKNVARLIYSLFYELDTGKTISSHNTMLFFKDDNPKNVAYSNLEVVSKKEGYKRLGRATKQIQLFSETKANEIRERYMEGQNGKKNINQYLKTAPSIRDLAEEYGCSTTIIAKIIKGEY